MHTVDVHGRNDRERTTCRIVVLQQNRPGWHLEENHIHTHTHTHTHTYTHVTCEPGEAGTPVASSGAKIQQLTNSLRCVILPSQPYLQKQLQAWPDACLCSCIQHPDKFEIICDITEFKILVPSLQQGWTASEGRVILPRLHTHLNNIPQMEDNIPSKRRTSSPRHRLRFWNRPESLTKLTVVETG